jgi:two-component system cell cycle response regulator
VFYYLVKPIHYNVLSPIISTAMRDALRKKKVSTAAVMQNNGFGLLNEGEFHVTTPQQAENLAMLLAGCYTDPARIFTGLVELMLNGIEHGNLKIGFKEKEKLAASNIWPSKLIAV